MDKPVNKPITYGPQFNDQYMETIERFFKNIRKQPVGYHAHGHSVELGYHDEPYLVLDSIEVIKDNIVTVDVQMEYFYTNIKQSNCTLNVNWDKLADILLERRYLKETLSDYLNLHQQVMDSCLKTFNMNPLK